MFQFIITNIFLVSLGVVLYVAVRTLPRIDTVAEAEKKGAWERWLSSGLPEKIDKALNRFLFKILRRFKVFLLRADNVVNTRLQKIKPDSEASNVREREKNNMFEVLLPGKSEGGGVQKQTVDFRTISDKNNGEGDVV